MPNTYEPNKYDLLIKNGTICNHDGIWQGDIAVANEKIVSLAPGPKAEAKEIIDAKGLTILPGVIDSQVHFREPGNTHKEDLKTGSLGAAHGGVTLYFEMPNTNPLTTCEQTLADKVKSAKATSHTDFAFYVGGTAENIDQIPVLERLEGSAGIKVFIGSSTGNLLVDDAAVLEKIIAKLSRRAAFHSEDEARLNARKHIRRDNDPASHPEWRDPEAAMISTKLLVGLAEKYKKKIHVLHISTKEEMAYLKHHKNYATVEVTPQHLILTGPEIYEKLGTKAQMNPPLRDKAHADGLWAGLMDGTVDVLGSDHAPHTLEEKAKPYPQSPSGMTGVQTLVPIMLDQVNKGNLSLERFVDLTSHGPGRIFQLLGKGRIAASYDADFTIVDLKRTKTITNDWIKSRSGWTPYDGVKVTGWPVGTIIRGQKAMWQGETIESFKAKPAKFL